MAREEPAPTAHISSAKGGQDPPKGSSKRQGKGRRKKDGQSAEPANAAPDSSAAAASIQAEDKPAPAPRTSRITYVPIARQSSADVDSAHSKDTRRQDKTPAKQPVRDRRCEGSGIPCLPAHHDCHLLLGTATVRIAATPSHADEWCLLAVLQERQQSQESQRMLLGSSLVPSRSVVVLAGGQHPSYCCCVWMHIILHRGFTSVASLDDLCQVLRGARSMRRS